MNANRTRLLQAAATSVAALAVAGQAAAADPRRALRSMGPGWVPVAMQQLAAMRGGFQLPSGMQLSFGVERVVYVNNQMVANTRVVIPDVARMTVEQATALSAFQDGLVVQVGEGNRIAPGQQGSGLVVQNSLDGQDIRAITTLNVGVDTLGAFQALNAQQALQDALLLAPGYP